MIWYISSFLCICIFSAAAAAKSLQSCPTLCDPIDGSPTGSPVPGILQARTLEWVAISFSNAWKWKVKVKSLSRVRLFTTPWSTAYQAPPSMGFSRQEYWSWVPSPSPCIFSKLSLIILSFGNQNINLLAGKERWHRCTEWTCGHSGEGRKWDKWRNSINIYTLTCVKRIACEKLLWNTGSSALCSVIT